MNNYVAPPIKWVGGKRQLLEEIVPRIPEHDTYYEPFLGGGAVFFALQPNKAVLSDYNYELINLYRTIKTQPQLLIENLRYYSNTEEDYYKARDYDRDEFLYQSMCPVQKAARFLYLNKTGFNGLYRVNKKGHFNVPYGKNKDRRFLDEENIMKCHKVLKSNDISVTASDFTRASDANKNDFVYFDPPYVPLSITSSFTSYTKTGFGMKEQKRLLQLCDTLNSRGVKWMLSNSSAPIVYTMYNAYNIIEVNASRNVAASSSSRKRVKEVLVTNN